MDYMDNLRVGIRRAVNLQGITQHELAQRAGISSSTLALLMTQGTGINLRTLVKLSKALNVSIDELLAP